ncbi:MAG: helix-turn-helix domain-containing protein [Rhodospirillaceae bacterium]|nr:helix-turn-helix domain-containing protein [Rhodospirillaceae bacterium]
MHPSEVASKDGVSIKTVLRWIEDGLLAAYKLGGQWRISPKDHRKFRRERWNG